MNNDKYLTVLELTKIIKMKFDNSTFFNKVYIKGEISNFKRQFPSNHCYFTIKDSNSRISAIMFNFNSSKLGFEPKDGDNVFVTGKISVYEATGNYQIYVEEMNTDGEGELYKKYLELKKELEKEGLFELSNKKEIPKFPKKIGIVTASTGAAIKDILNTIERRYKLCETILFPCLVQGKDAYKDIVKQIKKANEYDLDVLIVGRGGGSIEDLWPFNEKEVAYAIYNSKIPIISAVGHQIDFTIADFVADLRAATPTAAAELATPNIEDILLSIDNNINNINKNISNKILNIKNILKSINESYILKNPLKVYEIKKEKVNSITKDIINYISSIIISKKNDVLLLSNSYILKNPNIIYEKKYDKLLNLINKTEILNPLNSLKRGYSILKINNKSINTVKKIKEKDIIDITLHDGIVNANVINIKEDL